MIMRVLFLQPLTASFSTVSRGLQPQVPRECSLPQLGLDDSSADHIPSTDAALDQLNEPPKTAGSHFCIT